MGRFSKPTRDEWVALAAKELKGGSFKELG
jgi:hypothetical protein